MRNAVNKLSTEYKALLAEVSVNPILKDVLQAEHDRLGDVMCLLNIEDENFKAHYKAYQEQRRYIAEILTVFRELFEEFYKHQPTAAEGK